jgi:hypothetical protein
MFGRLDRSKNPGKREFFVMSTYDPLPSDPYAAPPAKRSSNLKVILIVLGVLGVLGMLCCGALIGGGFWAANFAMTTMGTAIQPLVAFDPTVQEKIGDIQSIKGSLMETGTYAQQSGQQNVIVFDIQGSKGSGKLIAKLKSDPGKINNPDDFSDAVEWIKLRIGDEEFPIDIQKSGMIAPNVEQ